MMLSCPTYQLLINLLDLKLNGFKPTTHTRDKIPLKTHYEIVCLNTVGEMNRCQRCMSFICQMHSNLLQTFTEHIRGALKLRLSNHLLQHTQEERIRNRKEILFLVACCFSATNQDSIARFGHGM